MVVREEKESVRRKRKDVDCSFFDVDVDGHRKKTRVSKMRRPSPSTELPLLSLFDPSAYCDTSRTPTRSRSHVEKDSKSSAGVRENAHAVSSSRRIAGRLTPDVWRIVGAPPPSVLSKKKYSPFHVLHQVLSLRVSGRSRSLGGVVVIAVVVVGSVVVFVLQVGEVPRVDVGRVVRRRDGKLVVLGTAGLLLSGFRGGRERETR